MNPKEVIHESWKPVMGILEYDSSLIKLNKQILPNISYQPAREDIFKVFSMPVNDIRVVILGQDPYPTPGDAIGYSFATRPDRNIPKSLRVIVQEINKGAGEFNPHYTQPGWKTLEHWTEQGIFLLNSALTVKTATAGSHLKYWNAFTKKIVQFISAVQPCIWVMWGKKAQSFIPYIKKNPFHVKGYDINTINGIPANTDYNYILTSPHPAVEFYPGDSKFYGCNHFLFINKILSLNKYKEIIY